MLRGGLVLVLATLLPAAACPAATVELRRGPLVDEERVDIVEVAAAPGEVNTLTVTVSRVGADRQGSDTLTTIHDATSPLTIAGGCTAVDANTVRCQASNELGEVKLTLGDGDDQVDLKSVSADSFYYHVVMDGGEGDDRLATGDGGEIAGGPGNDVLTGSSAYESLDGGPGDDRLSGGGGGDYVLGGSGDDVLRGGPGNDDLIGGASDSAPAPAGRDQLLGEAGDDSLDDGDDLEGATQIGPDHLDGGPGTDSVHSYIRRTAPVRVDLRSTGPAGQDGENDSVQGVERAFGGEGADTLTGDAGPNWLDGRDGDDTVHGGAGADLIFADGRDRVTGDAGGDDIRTVPQFAGRLACGAGQDVVRIDVFLSQPRNLRGPLIEPACERLSSGTGFLIDPLPRLDRTGRLTFSMFKFRCCRLRLALSLPLGPFARIGSVPIHATRVRIPVSRALAQRIRGAGALLRATVETLGAAPFVWRFVAR